MNRRSLLVTDLCTRFALALFQLFLALTLANSVHAQAVARVTDPNYLAVKAILQTPEESIDLAKAKIAIDRMIEPSVDGAETLRQLDALARGIQSMLPAGASSRLKLDALRYHIYQPSPLNNNRPFQYNFDDPFGSSVRNKLLATYLATRKGNCVSMPLLFVILGQKMGIDVTASTAPNHVFVKYRDSDRKLYNLETTSGAGFTRDVWMRQQSPMTDESIASGIYMRYLTRKETVVVMIGALLESYEQRGLEEQRIAMAKLALKFDPKSVTAILHEHQAYLNIWRRDFVSKYPTPDDIPESERVRLVMLEGELRTLYSKAYALGWRPLDQAAEVKYQSDINRVRTVQ